jgi:putative transposase
MDERYLIAAMRYVENNPVRANLVQCAQDYAWSSAKAHVLGTQDNVLTRCYLTDQVKDWSAFLMESDQDRQRILERSIQSGRPAGSEGFVGQLEKDFGRPLKTQKAGRKPKADPAENGQPKLFVA